MSASKPLHLLLTSLIFMTSIFAAPSSNEQDSTIQCGFKLRTVVLPGQTDTKSKFNNLFVLSGVPGGGGTPDILLDFTGATFCYNQTQISEDQTVLGQEQNMDVGRMLLQVPDDNSSMWNRVLSSIMQSYVPGTETDGNYFGISDEKLTYSGERLEPWARWKGWMGKLFKLGNTSS
jgi:hypothetical protein